MTGIGQDINWYNLNRLPIVKDTFSKEIEAVEALENYVFDKLDYYCRKGYISKYPFDCKLLTWSTKTATFAAYDSIGSYIGHYTLTRVQFNNFLTHYTDESLRHNTWALEPVMSSKYFYSLKSAA